MPQQVDIIVAESEQPGTRHTLSSWLKNSGDRVEADTPLVELETDKVMVEVSAPASGILKTLYKNPGDTVEPGAVLGQIEVTDDVSGTAKPPLKSAVEPDRDTPATGRHGNEQLLSPAVRRLVRQHQVDLQRISGSGKRGRVTKQDVLSYLRQANNSGVQDARQAPQPPAGPTRTSASTHLPHDNMRRQIARRMSQSLLHTAPHVTSIFEADLSAIMQHRRAQREAFATQGVNLTLTAYFVYAAVKALQSEPKVNSRFHEESLELFSDINIGVGTALQDQGLIVPVIQQAQNRNLLGIAAELQRLTGCAREGKLTPADIQGGTFTLSNHGVSGSLVATPVIINQPQSAILGIGKIEKRVVVKELEGEDVMTIRPMAYITLTIDHRALDAYQTNRFLSRFVEVIEHWQREGYDSD